MIAEAGDFITRHLNNTRAGWPLHPVLADDSGHKPREGSGIRGLNILIVGELAIEFAKEVKVTAAELLESKQAPRKAPADE